MLTTTKCKRCGKVITTLTKPLNSSVATMEKWQGICSSCLSDKEKFLLMLDMNNDIKGAIK